jgi:uncharacterized protein DUF4232
VKRRLVLLAALAALAGCGGSDAGKATAGHAAPLVPWSDEPVPALAGATTASAAPCRAAQLRPDGDGFTFQASVGGAAGSVVLRNAGKVPCRLSGRPGVRFVGAPRAPRQRQVALPPEEPSFPQVRRPDAWLRAIPPGEPVALAVVWRNWCVPGADAGTPLVPPTAARVTLPGGGSLDVPYNAVTTCERPEGPSTIGVRPFQPPLLPDTEPWTAQRLTARILTVDGARGPVHGRRGEVARYAVELYNAGSAAVGFDTCPFAVQTLAPAGHPEAHALNCAEAKPLAPGSSLRLEMRIAIPADAPTGPNGLFWVLDPTGAHGPEAVGRLIVDP